jgi:hypothetical protein
MAGENSWFEEPGDELEETEYPESAEYDDDQTETAPCPNCGAEIYEDAVACPVCGTYVTTGSSIWTGRPAWWILLGLLGTIVTIAVLAGLASW